MNFLEVMEKRHSSRDFKKDEISEDTLKEIVKIAGMSPSWENSQPWNVYIATGETLESIRETWIGEINHYILFDPPGNVVFLVLHALFSFTLPYVFITVSLNYLEAGTVLILSSCGPVAAMLFGMLFYQEIPSPLMVMGLIITMFALFLLSKHQQQNKQQE